MPDSLDTTPCQVDAMCQDSGAAESEKVCANMRALVCLCECYMHAFFFFVCLCAWFAYVTFYLCVCVRGSRSVLESRLAVKCDGRK